MSSARTISHSPLERKSKRKYRSISRSSTVSANNMFRLEQNLLTVLKGLRNPTRAAQKMKYLKGTRPGAPTCPVFGVDTPVRKQCYKSYFNELDSLHQQPDSNHRGPGIAEMSAITTFFYDQPERDCLYAANDIFTKYLRLKSSRLRHELLTVDNPQLTRDKQDLMQVVERMCTHKPWWDTVDMVARNVVGSLVLLSTTHPGDDAQLEILTKDHMTAWSRHENLWLRRTAILHQLAYKEAQTDVPLLLDVCEQSITSDEFFLQKGIGWALREHSKGKQQTTDTALKEVVQFLEKHEDVVSNLTRREALKWASERGLL